MATSLRLPDVLKAEAARYAGDLGISINALVAVALREYLDKRPPPARGASGSQSPVRTSSEATVPAPPGASGVKRSEKPARKRKRRR